MPDPCFGRNSVTTDKYTIHRCRQAQKDEKRFTRLYAHPNGSHKPHVKIPQKKTGAVAIIDEVPRADVFLSGPYSNTGRTDDATLRSVRAAGCSVVYEDEPNDSPAIAMPTLCALTSLPQSICPQQHASNPHGQSGTDRKPRPPSNYASYQAQQMDLYHTHPGHGHYNQLDHLLTPITTYHPRLQSAQELGGCEETIAYQPSG
jgi:hypothetical protein